MASFLTGSTLALLMLSSDVVGAVATITDHVFERASRLISLARTTLVRRRSRRTPSATFSTTSSLIVHRSRVHRDCAIREGLHD